MRSLVTGIAAVALASSLAHAQPGKNANNGNDKAQAAVAQEGDPDRAAIRGSGKQRGDERGNDRQMQGSDDGNGNGKNKADPSRPQETPSDSGTSDRAGPAERSELRRASANAGAGEPDNSGTVFENRGGNGLEQQVIRRSASRAQDTMRAVRQRPSIGMPLRRTRTLIEGCPPGLARKNNGCTPPGLARGDHRNLHYYRPDYFGYTQFGGGRYLYDNGYLMRLDGQNGIAGFLPLLGGALSIGEVWPSDYRSSPLPDYYVDYYNLGQPRYYRYADDVIYRVDPDTAAISSIAALLTGDNFRVGRPMPSGYDIYNVPYSYRDTYYDRPDAIYRYSDGYIYEVDPATRLVTTAIELVS